MKQMKNKRKIAVLLLVVMVVAMLAAACGSSHGDGETSCLNCGRETKNLSYRGFCRSCQDGFDKWKAEQEYWE